MMMNKRSGWMAAAAFVLGMAMGQTAFAQAVIQVDPSAQENPNGETSNIKVLPPAYEAQMMRLAEILGGLHYLRELCGANEGQTWRDEMKNLIDAEEPSPERRVALIAQFNRGFRAYREIYRECTPAAIEANDRYIRQGIQLSAEIPNRYGR